MKTKNLGILLTTCILGFLGIFLLSKANIFAVTAPLTATSLVTSYTTINAASTLPVFKLTFGNVESGETLQNVNVILNSSATGNAAVSDVLEDNRVYDGGWQLWKDSPSGISGTFERYTDQQILLSSSALNYGTNGNFSMTLDTAQTLANGDIYYVVIRTDDSNISNTTFSVSLKANGITTSGSSQPTNSLTQTSDIYLSVTAKLLKLQLPDGGLSSGNRIKLIFNQAIDSSYLTSTTISTSATSYYYYVYSYDSSWNQLHFGSGATVAYSNEGGTTNDTIIITLGSNPTITTSAILYYSIPTASSGGWTYGSKHFDTTSPSLIKAELITDVGSDGEANDIGDEIAFMFNESIDVLSEDGDNTTSPITPSNINTVLPPSGGASYDNSGAKPTLTWWGPSIVVITLRNSLSIDLIGKSVNPSNTVKDIVGNVDNTTTAPAIAVSTLPPVTGVTLSDIDTANSYVDKNDIAVDYVLPSYANNVTSDSDFHVDIYLLPEDIGLNTSAMYRINSANLTRSSTTVNASALGSNLPSVFSNSGATIYRFNGADSNYGIYNDSRTNFEAMLNNIWSGIEYYAIDSTMKYVAYAVVSTDAHGSETISSPSIPRPSEPILFTSDPYSEITTSQPWIRNYSPNNSSVYTTIKTFTMTWSEGLNETKASTLSNYALKYDSDGNWSYDSETPLTSVTYDSETFTVTLKTSTNLAANSWYHVEAKSAITDLYGTSVGSYGGFYFQTGNAADTTPPTVSSSNITNNQTEVSPSLSSINIKFNESMDPLTITTTSATLNPSVPGIDANYEISSNTLQYTFGNVNLSANTSYTFTLSGATIADAQGNFLDGDSNGSAEGNYSLSFTTGALDTVAPKISWSDFDGYTLLVGFDKEMKESDVETKENWVMTCDDVTQSLTWTTLTYDAYNFELEISGLYCISGSDYTITAGSSIRGGNNKVIDSTADSSTGTVESNTVTTGAFGDTTSTYYSYYSPISVWPSDSSSSTTTNYSFSLPITKALEDGSKIVIDWPSGFDISGATVRATSGTNPSYYNGDINGSWAGLYDQSGGTYYSGGVMKIFDTASSSSCPSNTSCIDNDSFQNRTTLTVWLDYNDDGTRDTNAVTSSTDSIYFDLAGVVNPSTASTVDWYTNTGGYKVSISTKTPDGAPLQSAQQSSSFTIVAAGTGTMTCSVHANTSDGTGVEGATCSASGWYSTKSCTTNSNGICTISGAQNGSWWFWIQPPSSGRYTSDSSSYGNSCQISDSAQTCTFNGILKSLDYSISGTITHPVSLANKIVTIWQYGQSDSSWSNIDVTLEADGSTNYTIYTTLGKKEIGLYEKIYSNDIGRPSSKTINVTANTTAVNFILTVPDKPVRIRVRDQDDRGLSNVSVGIYCYDMDCGSSASGNTGSDGTVTLNMTPGDYECYAYQSGYGNAQKSVSVALDGTVTPTEGCSFRFRLADSTIAGTVLDDQGTAIQWASINYKDSDGTSQWGSTNATGDYLLYVPGGVGVTGTVIASSWQHGGNLPAATGVDATNFPVAANSTITGINFQYDPNAYGTISGQVIADDDGLQWAGIWAQEVNRDTGRQTGTYGNWTSTDSSGNYTLNLTKNTASTCYDVSGWTSNYGELPPKTCLDISTSNLTGKNWDLGSIQTLTVTVTGAPNVSKAYLDVKQSGVSTGMWSDIDLANGSGTASFDIMDGTYESKLYIEGFGEFSADSSDANGFTVSGSNKSLNFNLASVSAQSMSVNGTVRDSTGNPVANARVTFVEASTGVTITAKTDSDGEYSMVLMNGNYTASASKSNYGPSANANVTAEGTINLSLTSTDSISGTVVDLNNTAVNSALVVATNGEQSIMTRTEGDGTFTLDIPDSNTLWNIESVTETGYRGVASNVSEGTTSLSISADTQFISNLADPVSTSTVETQSFTLDSENIGITLMAPTNLYNDSVSDNGAGSLTATEIPATSAISESLDVIDGKFVELTLQDSGGQSVTNFQGNLDLNFTYDKTEIEAAMADDTMNINDWSETPQIAYFEESTQTMVTMPTIITAQVKLTAASDFVDADLETTVNNLITDYAVDGDLDIYADYKIMLHSSTNHLTLFGVVVPTDTTAPSAPTGLTATTGDGRVILDWNNNSESDLMEYNVYRSTSSTVQLINANQINGVQVTSSAYTDTTVSNGTRYYYVVTAVDTSGNESSASSSSSATPTATADTTAPSVPSGLSATGGNATVTLDWSDNSEQDFSKYNIYRSTSSTVQVITGNKINTANVTSSRYTDSTVVNGNRYYYVVTAVDTSGNESSGSSTVNATPSAPSSTTSTSSSGGGSGGGYSSSTTKKSTTTTTGQGAPQSDGSSQNTSIENPLPFTDTVGHWAESYIQKLYSREVVSGYNAENYGPDNNLTRAELSKILLNLWGIQAPPVIEAPFKDIETSDWHAGYVAKMKELGVIEGYNDGTFKPNQAINRAETLKMLFKMAGKSVENVDMATNPFSDVAKNEWYAPYIIYASQQGYVNGYVDSEGHSTGIFGPDNNVTRGEIAKIAALMLNL